MSKYILKNQAEPKDFKINYQQELNGEQYAAVTSAEGPCLVLAGAGSGKTRTIVYRVAYLLERGVAPENILLVTFTNKAAKEMLSRVEMLLGGAPTGLWGGTFHSVANRILRKYADRVGFKNNFTIMDEEDAKDMIKVCIKDLGIDTRARRFPAPAVLKAIVSYASNSRKDLGKVIDQKYPNFYELLPEIERVRNLYETKKRDANAMDFDDLLLYLLRLLGEDTGVRKKLSSNFKYILVDEYQDTNVIQAQIVMALGEEHGNIFVVGDDAQSIYSFRAANLKNILDFPKIYQEAKTFRLETNYRSTPNILEVANAIIEKNVDQFPKELKSVKKEFIKPNFVPAASAKQEAEFISQMILDLRDQGKDLSDIAVLFRASHHSQELEVQLVKRDIPYEYRGGVKFFERAHIKDVLAYLRIISNPQDEVAWFRVLGMQKGIGPVQAARVYNRVREIGEAKNVFEIEASEILEKRAQNGWQDFLKIWEAVVASDDLPSNLIRSITESDYVSYLEHEYPNWKERLEDLEQLAIFAEQSEDLSKFLNEISLYDDYGVLRPPSQSYGEAGQEAEKSDENGVVLSTIHQAKGLEWPVVFVINMADQAFPNKKALSERGGLEEERRLFYVATTRAEEQLYLTYPLTSGYDNLMFNQPSMFLQEIPDSLLERVELEEAFSDFKFSDSGSDEDVIVWDDEGETLEKKAPPKSLLRNIDEL